MKQLLSVALVALCAPPIHAQDDAPPEPEAPRGLLLAKPGTFDGYTLIAPLRSTSTYLVDMQGELVHEWKSEHNPGNSVFLKDDGNLLRCCREENDVFSGGGQGGRVQELDWDGEVVWDFQYSDSERMHHHDFAPMPNGNVLLIAWEYKSRQEAIAAGRDPAQVLDQGLWPDTVVEIEPVPPNGGEVVWEWRAWDHLVQDFDPQAANHGDVTAHPELLDINADHRDERPLSAEERRKLEEVEAEMRALGYAGDDEEDEEDDDAPAGNGRGRQRRGGDWLHTNAVDYHPELDLIVLSTPTLCELWVIDHSTTTEEAAGHEGGRWGHGGDLLYRWGNPRNYGAGTRKDRRLFYQHDAQWVGDADDLRLTVFNNGRSRPEGDYSSVDEIQLPFDPETGFRERVPGAPLEPQDLSWSYVAPDPSSFYSSFISGAQRMPNGNTLVCSGAQGRIFEVTGEGEVVWEFLNPFGMQDPPPDARPREAGAPGRGAEGRPAGGGDARRGGARGGGGPGGMSRAGLFRVTRIAPDHPGLSRLAR